MTQNEILRYKKNKNLYSSDFHKGTTNKPMEYTSGILQNDYNIKLFELRMYNNISQSEFHPWGPWPRGPGRNFEGRNCW